MHSFTYDAFGALRTATGPLAPFLFTGEQHDGYIKLYQMGARWYDYELGRWISSDTIVPDPANPQSLNRLSYVHNNPLRFADPTGHCTGDPSDPDNPDRDCWVLLEQMKTTWVSIFWISDNWTLEELQLLQSALGMILETFQGNTEAMKRAFASEQPVMLLRYRETKLLSGAFARYKPVLHAIWYSNVIFGIGDACEECGLWLLIHEMGHALDHSGNRDVDEFAEAAGWKRFLLWWYDNPGGYSNRRDKESAVEDFADSFTYFVFSVNQRYASSPESLRTEYGRPNVARAKFFQSLMVDFGVTYSLPAFGPHQPR